MRTRSEIMAQWDGNRIAIANGCASSGPRDWFEGVLDDADARIAELEAALSLVDDDVRHHLRDAYAAPGTSIPSSVIRPRAIKAVRDALAKSTAA